MEKTKFKRSKRRHCFNVKFEKRINKWLSTLELIQFENNKTINVRNGNGETVRQYIRDGYAFNFLRTTGSPCNCYMCSGEHKYRTYRAKEKKVLKKIEEEINAGIV